MAEKKIKIKNRKYQITPVIWFVKDEKSVKFHVQNDDYFGTIATIMSLIEQKIEKADPENKMSLKKSLKNMGKDLMFLQKNYKIIKK